MFKHNIMKKTAVFFLTMSLSGIVMARDLSYSEIFIEDISRYNEDRIVYQQVEYVADPEQHQKDDTSIASLLIIRDKKMYLFKDGYDDHKIVEENRIIKEMENRLIRNELWERQIDGKPDFLVVTDRRTEIMKRITTKPTDNIAEQYSAYYQKIRDTYIQEHVKIFRSLIINRRDAEFRAERNPIPKRLSDNGETKFTITVTAKTKDGVIYYAEDSDGDGITETFCVHIPDGFGWGYQSGSNIIFIYKNTQENIKGFIGNLAREAYEGTSEEEQIINDEFKTLEDQTMKLIEDLVRVDVQTKESMKGSGK